MAHKFEYSSQSPRQLGLKTRLYLGLKTLFLFLSKDVSKTLNSMGISHENEKAVAGIYIADATIASGVWVADITAEGPARKPVRFVQRIFVK